MTFSAPTSNCGRSVSAEHMPNHWVIGATIGLSVDAKDHDWLIHRARAIAALNHPRICTLYDIGPDYLEMEHVGGKPLCGPLPLEKVLESTRQICEAPSRPEACQHTDH